VKQKAGTSSSDPASPFADAPLPPERLAALAAQIKQWGAELGFQQVGIADTQLQEHE
jgi:epoxyqueuosine reductase